MCYSLLISALLPSSIPLLPAALLPSIPSSCRYCNPPHSALLPSSSLLPHTWCTLTLPPHIGTVTLLISALLPSPFLPHSLCTLTLPPHIGIVTLLVSHSFPPQSLYIHHLLNYYPQSSYRYCNPPHIASFTFPTSATYLMHSYPPSSYRFYCITPCYLPPLLPHTLCTLFLPPHIGNVTLLIPAAVLSSINLLRLNYVKYFKGTVQRDGSGRN